MFFSVLWIRPNYQYAFYTLHLHNFMYFVESIGKYYIGLYVDRCTSRNSFLAGKTSVCICQALDTAPRAKRRQVTVQEVPPSWLRTRCKCNSVGGMSLANIFLILARFLQSLSSDKFDGHILSDVVRMLANMGPNFGKNLPNLMNFRRRTTSRSAAWASGIVRTSTCWTQSPMRKGWILKFWLLEHYSRNERVPPT